MNLTKKLAIITGASMIALGLGGCGAQSNAKSTPSQTKLTSTINKKSVSNSKLADLNYRPGESGIVKVNNNHSTLHAGQWKHDHINYQHLDSEKRTSHANVGTIEKRNETNDKLRVRQTVNPIAWHQKKIAGQWVLNRGHLIAYSMSKGIAKNGKYNPKAVSGDQNNPRNLFTQTQFSNQELQTVYEGYVRNALKHNEKVVYSVQPVFKGRNKMAKGVHMMALSTNHKLNFNVYLFNVQPGAKFNYQNGEASADRNMKVPTPKNAPHFNDNKKQGRYNHYNRRGYHHYNRRNHYWRYHRSNRRNGRRESHAQWLRNHRRHVNHYRTHYNNEHQGKWGRRWNHEEYNYKHPKKTNPYKNDPLL